MMNFTEILKECGILSNTRISSWVLVLFWMAITVYDVYEGGSWTHYEIFTITSLSAAGVLIAYNKGINSIYNTAKGEVGKPLATNTPVQIGGTTNNGTK